MKIPRGRFSRHVASTLAASVGFQGISLLATAILVRALGPADKGLLDLSLLVPQMLALLLGAGVGAANGYFAGSRRFTIAQLSANSTAMVLVATVAGAAVLAAGVASGAAGRFVPGVPAPLIFLAAIALPFLLASTYLNALLQGLQRIPSVNLVTLGQSLIYLLLTVLLVQILDLGLNGALVGFVATSVASFALSSWLLRAEQGTARPRWSREVAGATLRYGMKAHAGSIVQFLNYRLDVFLVNAFLGSAQVGIYGISARLAETLWYLPNAVAFVIFPKAAAGARDLRTFTPKVFWITLGATALAGIGLLVVGRPLIVMAFSRDFAGAYPALVGLLPGAVLLGGAKVLSNDIAGRGFPHYNAINAVAGLLFTVVLDVVLIPRYGIVGAALASSVAYAVVFAGTVVMYLKVRGSRGVDVIDR